MSSSHNPLSPSLLPGQGQDSPLLRWLTDSPELIFNGAVDSGVWLWEAIQSDFNEERSTAQIAFDTVISIIPLVDQICDLRDLVANCKQINKAASNTWAWVSLGLTLIGLFPSLGSLVKRVLKIFFLYLRRYGLERVGKAVNAAMDWVITYRCKPQVQAS